MVNSTRQSYTSKVERIKIKYVNLSGRKMGLYGQLRREKHGMEGCIKIDHDIEEWKKIAYDQLNSPALHLR